MDEVVEQLEAAAISENEENKTNFENLYKNRGRMGNQEERRKDILETQKGNRNSKLDKFRGILELVQAVEDDTFQTPRTYWKPTIYVSGFTRVANYSNILMMSEWMYEKPSDFAENWLMVPCPKGTRMLVVAYKGITKCFNKFGNFRFECRTALPGGNPCQIKSNKCTVVLDCFYHKESNTMHVLDILAWNDCVMTECEAGFRHFWMTGHLEQIPELQVISKKNKMIFKLIPKLPCNTESLNTFLSTYPFFSDNLPSVDGLLFYHQNAQYFTGETPLVGWLYPYMLPEILGTDLTVHKEYMLEKPDEYNNYMDFIEKFEQKNCRKKQRKMFGPKNMDTENDTSQKHAAVSKTGTLKGNSKNRAQAPEGDNGTTEEKTMDTDSHAVAQGETGITEEKTMDTDSSSLAQDENVTKGSTNGDAEVSILQSKGGDEIPEPKTSPESENMEADTNGGNMEAMVADIVKEEEK